MSAIHPEFEADFDAVFAGPVDTRESLERPAIREGYQFASEREYAAWVRMNCEDCE